MRLYKRGKTWWVEIARGTARSLRTENEQEARIIFAEMELERLRGRVPSVTKSISLSKFIEVYLDDRADRSAQTIKKDRVVLHQFLEVVGDIPVSNITSTDISKFKRACRERGLANISINSHLRHLQAALRWAHRRKYLSEVPEIEFTIVNKRLYRILTPEEIQTLLNKALEMKGPAFHAYLNTLLMTGARRAEAKKGKFFMDQGYALFTETKGNQDRMVPLVPKLVSVLKETNGEWVSHRHDDTLSKWFREVADACGLHDVRLHDLRHNAATYMVKSGMHLRAIQMILGHRDVKTTELYAKVLDQVTATEIQKLSFV